MTLIDIMKQAQTLSPQDRKELVKMLVDSLDIENPVSDEHQGHWGKNMLGMIEKVGPIDLIYPEIEDPVEWVSQIRRVQRLIRLDDSRPSLIPSMKNS